MNAENRKLNVRPDPDARRIFTTAKVIDTNDPLLLGRVRVKFDNKNNSEILKSIPNTKNNKNTKTKDNSDLLPEFKWTDIDKFVCQPLLPVFLKMTPKSGERVNIFVPNREYEFNQLYYTPAAFSTVLTQYQESDISQEQFINNRLPPTPQLKNNINNQYNGDVKGAFIEPQDIGIAGRGTCDIVLKDNDVIIRAGKTNNIPINSKKLLSVKSNRSFLQLSNFTETLKKEQEIVLTQYYNVVSYVKNIVEWTIFNGDNQYDLFSFKIELFGLPEKKQYTTENLSIDTEIPPSEKSILFACQFSNKSFFEMTQIITKFITQCNQGRINIPPYQIYDLRNQFPLYYRPSNDTYLKMKTNSDTTEGKKINEIYNSIIFSSIKGGSGLISSQNKTGSALDTINERIQPNSIDPNKSTTYLIGGADKIIFHAHGATTIPGKKQVGLENDSVYGINQDFIVNQMMGNTEPMIRGNQMISFLNDLLQWVINHEHAGPGKPPTSRGSNSVTSQDLINRLSNALGTILNDDIRIN